jgi:hypothetical protein|tara:strand:+ start:116 stop:742 length:627 start_codon:yes stop_codon:yes gene_type:complete
MAKKTFKEHNKLKQTLKKRKVPIVTEGMRKKYGVCEHDNVNYKALEKLNKSLLLHCKRLSRDIDRKGKMMELWMNNRQLWTNKINKDYVKRAELHKEEIEQVKKIYQKKIDELQQLYDEAIEVNTDVVNKNRDCIKANREILKDHNDIVRAYNGLAEMGRYAEESGVDIKKHRGRLPEGYEFKQKHTLLESGKVKHSYSLKKKNGKDH